MSNWLFKGFIGACMLLGVLVALSIAFRVSGFLGGPGYDVYSIPSSAMTPTLRVGDHMFALANTYGSELPQRGEVVVFKFPVDRKTDYVKRVIGLPGDTVQYQGGRLYLNSKMVERTPLTGVEIKALSFSGERDPLFYWESLPDGRRYVIAEMRDDLPLDNTEELTVPPGNVFVLGDNRDNSADSRTWGFVPIDLLRDKPLIICWSKDRGRIGQSVQPQ